MKTPNVVKKKVVGADHLMNHAMSRSEADLAQGLWAQSRDTISAACDYRSKVFGRVVSSVLRAHEQRLHVCACRVSADMVLDPVNHPTYSRPLGRYGRRGGGEQLKWVKGTSRERVRNKWWLQSRSGKRSGVPSRPVVTRHEFSSCRMLCRDVTFLLTTH